MNINFETNIFRRKLTKNIAAFFVGKESVYDKNFVQNISIKKIAIIRPNHRLGNQLLLTPLLNEVIAIFPDCEIDLFLKGSVGKVIFSNYDNVTSFIELPKKHFKNPLQYVSAWFQLKNKKYDLIINAVSNSSSGKIATKISNAKLKFFGLKEQEDNPDDYNHIAKKTVYKFRNFLIENGFKLPKTAIPPLDLKLSTEEIKKGNEIVDGIVKNTKKTIALFTYATGNKCYSKEWWDEFYKLFSVKFANYNIIEILPVENISNLSVEIPQFYSTDIREIASVIANTVLFVGADSGMMHLASSSKTTTVGLFAVTNPQIYKPYGNRSVAIDTNISTHQDIVNNIEKLLDQNP